MIIWLIGISGSGKTSISRALFNNLKNKIKNLILIDGDEFRKVMGNDIGYSLRDRNKNAERMINFVSYISNQNINVICAANITSTRNRNLARKKLKSYFEVLIDVPIQTLIKKRDYKNLYKRALKKRIKNVVGIDIKYQKPKGSNLIIKNDRNKRYINVIVKEIIKKSKVLKRK